MCRFPAPPAWSRISSARRRCGTPFAQAWFPGGPADPDLALVAVLIAEAEYWDVKSNQAVQLFKMAKAAVTGKPPEDMGEHRRVRM